MIAGATDTALVLTNIQLNQAGDYSVHVTNSGGFRASAPATLTVIESYTTAQMSNVWSVTAGSRPYLTTDYMQYGMAFNPANSNLLVTSLSGGPTIAVLNALTGEDKHLLDVSVVSGGAVGFCLFVALHDLRLRNAGEKEPGSVFDHDEGLPSGIGASLEFRPTEWMLLSPAWWPLRSRIGRFGFFGALRVS